LVSSSHPDEKFIQVWEDADQIAQSIGPWSSFDRRPAEGE
jgi:hypothetical protein